MPATMSGARTKTVETRTLEEVPVGEGGGLGCLPLEYLAQCTEEELAIANVRVYRYDAGTPGIFLVKLDPAQRIDEDWIGQKFGGGTYGVKVYSKGGKSGFDRGVRIDPRVYGPAKDGPLSTSANGNGSPPAAPPPPANDAVMNRLIDAMERQSDRIERLFEQRAAPPAAPAAEQSVVAVMAEASKAAIGVVAEAAKQAIGAGSAREAPKENSFDQDLQRLKILKEIAAPAQAAPVPNAVEQVAQLATLIEAVRKLGGEGGGTDWKTALVDKGLDHIPELVDLGKSIMAGQNKQAEELRKREEARRVNLETIGRLQRQPLPNAPPAAGQPSAANAPAAPAEANPNPVSPLRVVSFETPPAAQAPEPVQPEIIPPNLPANAQEQAAMIQEFFKHRVVQLVAEGDEPAAVLDFIDRADPVIGAILTKASEKQIREFLAKDPILVEITRLPNYEAFLRGLLLELQGEGDEGDEGSPPPLKIK